tara:strand:+ start:1109 stop:3070 length:1962 start_codon:yes stop_codon:yes gene_type:complete
MQKRILCYAVACLLSLNVFSQYIYEGNQALIDLTNESNTTNLNAGDDQLSSAFNLDFTFNFYDKQFTSARMATNGCLHFGLGTANINYNNYCGDYTPDPLPQYNYTLFPFWTDLIRDSNSKMLAKNFNDKTVFGWYNMREYNRSGSDNSFEVILWTNSTFDFRYGELDINRHDVLIGQQKDSDTYYQYLFYDECNTGTTNLSSCVNVDWNNSTFNTLLENGGSLYGTSVTIDCSNPLNDVSCAGYWDAYDDLQCDLDPQYGPFCPGYRQEIDVGYYQEEEYFDYGYQEELFDYGYEEYDMYDVFEEPIIFEEYIFEQQYDVFEEPEFIFAEEIIFEQLQPLEEFIEPLPFIRDEEVFIPIEDLMIEEFVFQETFIEEVEEWFEEETIVEEELAYAEEPEEELIEEIVEEEDEIIEEEIEEELVAEEKSSSLTKEKALAVVASTIKTARESVYTTTGGNTSTNSSFSTSSSTSASSTGSISNSPSISDQFSSSTAQTNQLLDMSTTVTATTTSTTSVDSSISSTTSTTFSSNTNTSNSLQNQIDISVSSGGDTDAEQLVENIIAQNLQAAQEDVQAKQEETGQYGSENTIIAYMGFVPNFNNYRLVTVPDQEVWYEPTILYADNMLTDNIEGFYQMAGQSLEKLAEMKELQPPL